MLSAVYEHPMQDAVLGPEHEVEDEELRAPVEQLGHGLGPVAGLEAVRLIDGHPWKLLPLTCKLVAAAG